MFREKEMLSEKPEAQRAAVLWAKETQERIRRSDEATKELKEKYKAVFLENLKKAKV